MWPKKEDSQASKNSLRALDLADAKKITLDSKGPKYLAETGNFAEEKYRKKS